MTAAAPSGVVTFLFTDVEGSTRRCTRSVVAEISTAIIHLRKILGDQTYQSLARRGETMTTAEIVAYAYDQIDQARTELNAVSNETTSESLESQSRLAAWKRAGCDILCECPRGDLLRGW